MSQAFTDKELICIECKGHFIWTGNEQALFYEKGKKQVPKRCAACEQARQARRSEFGLGGTKARTGGGRW